MAVTNDLVSDNRVHKIATTLASMGFSVSVTGRKLPHSPELDRQAYCTKRIKLLFNSGPLFYAEYNLRLLFRLLFSRFDILVANDLDTLLACSAVKIFRNVHLVYDSHEFFTQVPELIHRPKTQKVWEKIEKWALLKTDFTYTVCDSIARTFQKKYNRHFSVIRNLPVAIQQTSIPSQLQLKTDKEKVILYQGALNMGRGLEKAIRAMQWVNNAKLFIAGAGDIESDLKQLCSRLKLDHKIIFLGRFPIEQLKYITWQAHLGISLEEDLGLNYRYALPNKIFDYIQAEVPVLCSNLPEMKKIVDEFSVGKTVHNSIIPEELALLFDEMLASSGQFQAALAKAKQKLTWQNESKTLEKIYSPLLDI